MKIIITTILISVLCLIKKNNKILFVIALLWLWLLMAFSDGNADAIINEGRYYNYSNTVGITEPGYYLLMQTFMRMGVSFALYKQIIAAIEIILIGSTIFKLSSSPNVVLALYALYPFCLDVVQMRFTLALSIVIFAIRYLFPDNTTKSMITRDVIFVILIVAASMFHFVAIFYLLLLIGKHLSMKATVTFVAMVNIIGFALFNPYSLLIIAKYVGIESKVVAYLNRPTSGKVLILTLLSIVIYIVTFTITYAFSIRFIRLQRISDRDFVGIKSNIISLCIIPFLVVAPDFLRILTGLSILNYITISNHLSSHRVNLRNFSFSPNNVLLIILLYITAFANLYKLVLGNANYYTVFLPLFFSNTLIR
ncbi:EpsG family protein [Bifidobacterium imperatoris]|uniref:EpsG family n=1 Tax=Bifidobacterium imperatoris TaxID=2020965 RepID=A0A2N5IRF5_9BIFI|nr:EpsG family protein [Bifidobacterium imperatoris]PLS24547.1 EpsG family [Bifidobacterium imperatoris]QSY58071.1 EpsG family protein [Bifidobacterium imperatoris]